MVAQPKSLSKSISAPQFFTMSFATIVGVGWMVILGDWLSMGGPIGSAVALLAAGVVMMLVGLCYAELGTSIPSAGGELAYAYEAFGLRTSFVTGWFLALVWVSAASFEAISAGRIAGILFPSLARHNLYSVHGSPVSSGTLAMGLAGTVFLTVMNYVGMKWSVRFQDVFTWSKIVISGALILAGIVWGSVDNLEPLISPPAHGSDKWSGVLAVFVAAPFWLAGFNSLAQVIEEKQQNTSYSRVAWALLLSIAAAATFYALLILACSMAVPWRHIVSLEFPALGAFTAALHSNLGARLVLFSGLLGLFATWNATIVAGSRVLFAMARAHLVHRWFSEVHPMYRSPGNSVIFVGLVSGIGIFLGRGVTVPIVNMDSSCLVFLYIVVSVAMIRLRILQPERKRPYRVRYGYLVGLLSLGATCVMLAESLYLPFVTNARTIPAEWISFLTWAILGCGFWLASSSTRKKLNEGARRRIILGLDSTEAPNSIVN
jgi:basic amino acid/polyamine antiporter, APA family